MKKKKEFSISNCFIKPSSYLSLSLPGHFPESRPHQTAAPYYHRYNYTHYEGQFGRYYPQGSYTTHCLKINIPGWNGLLTTDNFYLFFFLRLPTIINWARSWQNLLLPYANNKGADQSAHPHSLISAFVVHCLDSIIPLPAITEIARP